MPRTEALKKAQKKYITTHPEMRSKHRRLYAQSHKEKVNASRMKCYYKKKIINELNNIINKTEDFFPSNIRRMIKKTKYKRPRKF